MEPTPSFLLPSFNQPTLPPIKNLIGLDRSIKKLLVQQKSNRIENKSSLLPRLEDISPTSDYSSFLQTEKAIEEIQMKAKFFEKIEDFFKTAYPKGEDILSILCRQMLCIQGSRLSLEEALKKLKAYAASHGIS